MIGTLYVVATPIGNLEDLTPRARQTLDRVSLIAAEDTRHTGRLLMHIGVKTRLMALHDHNEADVVDGIIETLKRGDSVALVSDAGTPLVSDPGFRLVRAAHANGVTVSPLPGASAVAAAISVAGIASDRFCFEGFPPSRQAARLEWLGRLAAEERTLVIYESVHRIADCLADMIAVFGAQRRAFIGRELSKMHEQCVQETLGALAEQVADGSITRKGEFVVVIAGAEASHSEAFEVDKLLQLLGEKLPPKEAAGIVAAVSGLKKNEAYDRLLKMRQ